MFTPDPATCVEVPTEVTELLLNTIARLPMVQGDVVPRKLFTPEEVIVTGELPMTVKEVQEAPEPQETVVVLTPF